jgi:acyl-CoA reductase-like NAD-dependent aldehyde dehydrogenase
VPGCAWALTQIIAKAGVPPGVFNLVMGRGSVLGDILSKDPGIDAVSFTGSVAVGKTVAQNCAARLAKVQLEMGGKNPQVILDDADLDTAVNLSIQSAFFSTGQRCTASSRLIVTEGIHDRFVAAVTAKMRALRVDDALKDGTDIGPVVDERQLEQDLKYIELGGGWQPARAREAGLLPRARALRRHDPADDDQPRGNLRPGRLGDSGEELR